LGVCATILLGVHVFKILLGDSNRNNFLVSADGGRARFCDFASGELEADDVVMKQEEDGLLTCLESYEFDDGDGMWDTWAAPLYRCTTLL
jgi:hypothetical protein